MRVQTPIQLRSNMLFHIYFLVLNFSQLHKAYVYPLFPTILTLKPYSIVVATYLNHNKVAQKAVTGSVRAMNKLKEILDYPSEFKLRITGNIC